MDESTIAIIGGADGPTSILVAGASPWGIVGAVAVVAAAVLLGIYHAKKK